MLNDDAQLEPLERGLNRERLRRDLEAIESPVDTNQASALDDIIFNRARARFAGIERTHTTSRRVAPRRHRLRAAAGLALAAGLLGVTAARWSAPGHVRFAAEDVTRDGRVDIVDAYILARRIESRPPHDLPASWDLTGDGRIDHADVNRIASRAVALDTSGKETSATGVSGARLSSTGVPPVIPEGGSMPPTDMLRAALAQNLIREGQSG